MHELGNEKDIKVKLGQIIKLNRIKCTMTQSQLAALINCDQSVISRIEKGNEYIDQSIYSFALKQFNMSFEEQPEFKESIKSLITRFLTLYEEESFNELINLEKKIANSISNCKNILLNYELYVLECVLYYIKGEHEECKVLLNEIEPLIQVCNPTVQRLYTVFKCKMLYDNRNLDSILTTVISFFEENEGARDDLLLNYWLGVYYFLTNKRMLCLRHLYVAYRSYQEGNIVKAIKIRLMIALMLIRENKVTQAIATFLEMIKMNATHRIPMKMRHTLLSNLGYCYYLNKSYKKAIYYFELALEINDSYDYYFSYYFLLKLYKQVNDNQKFKSIANKVRRGIRISESKGESSSIGLHASFLYLKKDKDCDFDYYQYIERHIVDHVYYYFDKPIRFELLKELLEHYWNQKQYKKYRNLQGEIIKCYA
ncbi:helix-turn-helix domain-containing protein [Haloplasma contractile]|uniref:Transcriptional activator protein n=1 Tax=Haloplasma contractile SSD-17B TaxID=1033810 RepID=U2EES3_9MOLU|nr:helix-turn-helix domain-containing protein [Haloplasma contractile]ERJ13458.1 transcriptional activator protein [Haloplasma contractile SSD-17B]